MTLPIKIKEWLNARGISDSVLFGHKIDWNGNQIVIPINDLDGNFLFNKYRRDPFGPEDIPKYRYEKGSTAQLFNGHYVRQCERIIICEGENDAMLLEAKGYAAVSTTGGAGTFKDEWVSLFAGKKVFICYDNDDAGIQGAVKLLTKLPGARMVLIPREKGVKDVTDFFLHSSTPYSSFDTLLCEAEEYPILSTPLPEFKTISAIREQIKVFKIAIATFSHQEKKNLCSGKPWRHYKAIISLLLVGIKNLEREIKKRQYKGPTKKEGGDDMKRAKEVPIEFLYDGKLVKKGDRATGACPFHKEKTGSFVIYLDQNKFHCFGCNVQGDAIDFVKLRDGGSFITAIKTILKK